MLTQADLETILALSVALLFLLVEVGIYWILNGWQIEAIRRAFARLFRHWERDHRVESYVRELRKLAEDEGK